MRGWAALFVVYHHAWQFVVTRSDADALPAWFTLMAVFKFGHYAVPVFIVLSGYCLMLPVARSPDLELPGGLLTFVKRRARRILPPYYAALGLTLGLILACPRLQTFGSTQWNFALPALTPGSIGSHLMLVHNLFERWRWTIDPPLWSVALEWQIYFVFAFVLLPLWRRAGALATLCAAYVIGLLPSLAGYDFVSAWFLGLFALGMLAAFVNFSPRAREKGWILQRGWRWISAVGWLGVMLSMALARRVSLPAPFVDSLLGLATATFLAGATSALVRGESPWSVRLLERRVSVRLGEMSYSLYLIHYPLLALVDLTLHQVSISPAARFLVLIGMGGTVILGVTYAFHRLFERPFMRAPAAQPVSVAQASW